MELDCGIPCGRIVAWLEEELGLMRDGDGWAFPYAGASCQVLATSLQSRAFGSVEIERTSLRAHGDEAAVDEFRRLFILRFASAGG